MAIRIFGIIALLSYLTGIAYQVLLYARKIENTAIFSTLLTLTALISHAIFSYNIIFQQGYIDLSFFKAAVAISLGLSLLITLINLCRPLQIQILVVYPIATLTIIAAFFFHSGQDDFSEQNFGLLTHIGLSIFAYGILTLAAIQAGFLHIQNKYLKSNFNNPLLLKLPPLQSMESTLFEMLWVGFILLTLAIISGFIFIDDNPLTRYPIHKTVFSIIAWFTFAALLTGRHKLGWRGTTASKWTLWGSLFLMLGYFGSKFVLELILKK